jgi:hypothetical protein
MENSKDGNSKDGKQQRWKTANEKRQVESGDGRTPNPRQPCR